MKPYWVDVSIPLHEGMTVWPGDPPFQCVPNTRIAEGASSNTSVVTLGTHTGTHLDAPWHFESDGAPLDAVDPSRFFGDALVLDLTHVDTIAEADLPREQLPPRVLFKTRNSAIPLESPFRRDFVAIEPDAALRLVDDGVRLVGVDYLSVAPYKQPNGLTHHHLLRAKVLIVEGLRLAQVEPGIHAFIVLPLALVGADGAPCRAFIGPMERNA
ncbi:MAG TPA: cyclase family protein [Candidatus Hydrogenedentes bacterium]|nr:cyclase family protein [Candidatus Hydrogenedentota bacterium]HPG69522.1 cyclase family protein [Candidatus Hydrogenedentota bacterium]